MQRWVVPRHAQDDSCLVLAAGGALMARKAGARRDDAYAGRSSIA